MEWQTFWQILLLAILGTICICLIIATWKGDKRG